MNRKSLPVFLALGLAVIILLAAGMTPKNNEVFRIHIRADSDLPAAQAVKYKVKDAVVNFLTPVLAGCADKAEAMAAVRELLPEIEKEADAVLEAEGCAYRCRAAVRQEEREDQHDLIGAFSGVPRQRHRAAGTGPSAGKPAKERTGRGQPHTAG